MTNSLFIVVHAFARHVLMSFSVNVTLLPRLVNLSTRLRDPHFRVEILQFGMGFNAIIAFFEDNTIVFRHPNELRNFALTTHTTTKVLYLQL